MSRLVTWCNMGQLELQLVLLLVLVLFIQVLIPNRLSWLVPLSRPCPVSHSSACLSSTNPPGDTTKLAPGRTTGATPAENHVIPPSSRPKDNFQLLTNTPCPSPTTFSLPVRLPLAAIATPHQPTNQPANRRSWCKCELYRLPDLTHPRQLYPDDVDIASVSLDLIVQHETMATFPPSGVLPVQQKGKLPLCARDVRGAT